MLEVKTNLAQVQQKMEKDAKELMRAIPKTLQKWGNTTIRAGKKQKKYKRRSGNLDRSQKAKVNKKELSVLIYIDESLVDADGFNYGQAQHDGTKHIEADPWLTNAVKEGVDDLRDKILDDIRTSLG